ncbi:phosphate/phosphite/phosphonate ABC transporter substrate-binding protein [Streptomyces zagrosensis]|uniref:Phosphonate transport system substrate-binding protein n=1 Tax=Streptomyces zagrosensis TaxID=1042984 RepID=A0A7W9UY14_9ACTN|nr:phosphate/phosphite/phosphonate ABC transporter substrate-binding protein [Streptomyces zagrosensis]MBB5935478.1 phosphonate transport system substrate-binding protein [Streptomyces zagrosensis]
MISTLRGPLAAVCAVLALALTGCGSSAASDDDSSGGARDPGKLVVAAIPSEDSTSLAQRYEAVIKLLEDETGKEVVLQKATNYAAVIEAQRAHKADIAFYGPLSYVVAKDSGVDLRVIASPVKNKGDETGYRSVAVAKSGSNIGSLKDLARKKVCFVDENSTSGYLYPTAELIKAGVGEKDYTPIMSGGHDASVLAVNSGQCDGGFATEDMATRQLVQDKKIDKDDLKVLWKSSLIPGSPVAVSTDLADGLQRKIANVFETKANADYLRSKGYCSGGEDCLTEANWGYVKVDDADYNSVRDVCAATKNEQCKAGS